MLARTSLAAALCAALAACNPGAPAEPSATGARVQQPLPETLRLVGEAGPGERSLAGMRRDGISAAGAFEGREAGLAAFCTGAADALAVSSSLTDAQTRNCRDAQNANGVAWSALAGIAPSDAPILYLRWRYAEDFLARSSDYN